MPHKMRASLLIVCGLLFVFENEHCLVEGFGVGSHQNHRLEKLLSLTLSSSSNDNDSSPKEIYQDSPRRDFVSRIGLGAMAGLATVLSPIMNSSNNAALAAPPIAVIAEELGYFPVTNKAGEMVYVPKRVQRESSDQAIELAKKMSEKGAVFYGSFWCPHCARQKELLGREAFQYITYVECAPKGFGAQPLLCNKKDIDGYPTWVFRDKSVLSGERPLEDFAKQVNLKFDPALEKNLPPTMGSGSCK